MKAIEQERIVETWEKRMKNAGHQFAMIKTTNAIYDRVAIIDNLLTMLTIQFPKGSSRRKDPKSILNVQENFTIRQENIRKRDVIDIRYYKD